MPYLIRCTADRLPFSRVGEYLAYRNATQETWGESVDVAKRFATQQLAQDAIQHPSSEQAVPA